MGIEAILLALASEVGRPLAKALIGKLRSAPNAEDQFAKASAMVSTSVSALTACRTVFGKEFEVALQKSRPKPQLWTIEAGLTDYVRIKPRRSGRLSAVRALRDELNLNLERVAKLPFDEEAQ